MTSTQLGRAERVAPHAATCCRGRAKALRENRLTTRNGLVFSNAVTAQLRRSQEGRKP